MAAMRMNTILKKEVLRASSVEKSIRMKNLRKKISPRECSRKDTS